MVRNIMFIITFVFLLGFYYFLATSKHKDSRRMAALMKIALLALSIILTFARTEFLVFGDLAIGGRMPVMELAGFEIVDTIIEMRKG